MKNAEIGNSDLQDRILLQLTNKRHLTDIYLTNGIRLQGYINGFDKYTILLTKAFASTEDLASQIIYKHAISTVSAAVTKSMAS